jgi:glycosyltransferase involved in cell wall biosynthesis
MHQYRAVYELFDAGEATAELRALRDDIRRFDGGALGAVRHRFANSPRVAERLRQYNGLEAEPLAHPPPLAAHYRCADAEPYVFFPSRLESLKRQDLLIEAAARLRSDTGIVIAGDGGQRPRYEALIERLGVGDRVRLLGPISEEEKIALYAHCLAVFFGPRDEDYGYVTLEAMLAGKPVLTCRDSGGPLAFVEHDGTGLVLEPEPAALADAIDSLAADRARAAALGRSGRDAYEALGLSWAKTLERLLAV